MNKFRRCIKYVAVLFAISWGASVVYAQPAESSTHTVVTVPQPQVRVVGSQVEITIAGEDSSDVTVYALTGQVVKSLVATPGVTSIELPKGYYIVKCDRVSCRVIVK